MENKKLVHIVIFGSTRVMHKTAGGKKVFEPQYVIVGALTAALLQRLSLVLWIGVRNGKTNASWGCDSVESQYCFRRSYLGTLLIITFQKLAWYLKDYHKIVCSVNQSNNCGVKLFFMRNCFRPCNRTQTRAVILEGKEFEEFILLRRNDQLMQTYNGLEQLNEVLFVHALGDMKESILRDIVVAGKRIFLDNADIDQHFKDRGIAMRENLKIYR